MLEVLQDGERIRNDRMARFLFEIGDNSEAARVVLVLGKVEAARIRRKSAIRAAARLELLLYCIGSLNRAGRAGATRTGAGTQCADTIIMHLFLSLLHIYAFLCVAADSNKQSLQNQGAFRPDGMRRRYGRSMKDLLFPQRLRY